MTGPPPERRLCFARLEHFLLGIDEHMTEHNGRPDPDQPVMAGAVARVLHRAPNTIYRWRSEGIPLSSADAVAIHLDLHPSIIWPDFYDEHQPQGATT